MFGLSEAVWAYVGIFSTALALIFGVLLLWRRRELRRDDAFDVAVWAAEWGLTRVVAPFAKAYTIGNYFGKDSMGRIIRELVMEIRSGGLKNILRECGWKVVENVFVKNEVDRIKLFELLETAAPDEFGEEEADE